MEHSKSSSVRKWILNLNRHPVIRGLAGIISSRWIERNCSCHLRAWQQCRIPWVLLVSLYSVAGAFHNKLWNIKELVGDQGKKLLDLSCSTDKTFYILYVENHSDYFSCLKFCRHKWMFLQLVDFQDRLLHKELPGCGAGLFLCHSLKCRNSKFVLK